MANQIEKSVYGKWSKIKRWGSLALIFSGLGYELYCYMTTGKMHLDISSYCIVFLFIWLWHLAFEYTHTYTGKELIVEKKGFGVTKTYRYKMADVEGLTQGFKKNLLKREAGVRYISRFSWADDNPVHLIVLNKNYYPSHIMIKTSREFFEKIQQKHAEKLPSSVV